MDINIFKQISGYGRLAYGIMCFESTVLFYGMSMNEWSWVIKKLWEYSTSPNYDEWCYEFAEFHPDILLDNYSNGDFEYLSEEQFNRLCKMYRVANPVVLEVLKNIYELATADLYSKVRNEGALTMLSYLHEIIFILETNQIPLPEYEKLLKYRYNVEINDGFGEMVGIENSLILIK